MIAIFVSLAAQIRFQYVTHGFIIAMSVLVMAIFIYCYEDLSPTYIAFCSGVFSPLFRIIILLIGATRSSTAAWNTADIGIGIMCWINFIALLILSTKAVKLLKDYERQKKLGLDPVFEPQDCGIKNAELWTDIAAEKYSELLARKHEVEKKA